MNILSAEYYHDFKNIHEKKHFHGIRVRPIVEGVVVGSFLVLALSLGQEFHESENVHE